MDAGPSPVFPPVSSTNHHAADVARRLQDAGGDMVRKSLTLAAVLLAAFHVWLFADQAWAGELVDLSIVSRWVIAAGLVAALLHLHRRGVSLMHGRQPVAVWLLAALLHGPALARDLDVVTPSLPEIAATVAQAVTGLTVIGPALLILGSLRRRAMVPALHALFSVDAPAFGGARPSRCCLHFAPRPPPIAT